MLLNCAAKQYIIPNMVFWTAAQLQRVSNILIRTAVVLLNCAEKQYIIPNMVFGLQHSYSMFQIF